MKYLQIFESFNKNQDVKNKIFLIDTSGSFAPVLTNGIDEINFYLADEFTTILCSYKVDEILNVSLDSLISKIKQKYFFAGGGDLQAGIDYIIKNKLQGNVLLFTDGMIDINVKQLPNNLSILCTENINPVIKGNEKKEVLVFKHDLESLEHFYRPRDNSFEEYELKKAAKKYNL